MILDCCHSAGADREGEFVNTQDLLQGNGSIRQYINPPPIPTDCDSEIISDLPRGMVKVPGFQGQDLESHVCLAACSASQKAKEDRKVFPPRGFFTKALTAVLRDSEISELTYLSFINKIYKTLEDQTKNLPK